MSKQIKPTLQQELAELKVQLHRKNRELEIEAALDKVRARMLKMTNSSELEETTFILTQHLKSLGVVPEGASVYIVIVSPESHTANQWIVNDNSVVIPQGEFQTPLDEHPQFIATYEGWKNKEPILIRDLKGEELMDLLGYIQTLPSFDDTKEPEIIPERIIWSEATFSKGTLGIIHFAPLPQSTLDILVKFSKVFDLTYQRFLDLQKAEAQAREAQIEAALEKVRSRSLAIHKTNELGDVISLVFEKLKELDVTMDSAGILTFDPDGKGHHVWATKNELFDVASTYVPYNDDPDPINKKMYDLRESGKDFMDEVWSFEEKNMMYEYLFEHTDWKYLPDDAKQMIFSFEGWGMTGPLLQHTSTILVSYSQKTYSEHEREIIKRFGKVFEQAYIRYMDLEKAEAQAREAMIEAALEKVRSRTMAMQRSDELLDVASVLFQQVKALGVPQWNCGFNIWDMGDKEFTYYPGSPDGIISPSPCKIPLTEHTIFKRFDESRRRGDELFVYEKEDEEQADHYRYMLSLPGVGALLQSMLDAGFELPSFQIDHLANFAYGNLIFITYEHFPEMHDIFKRFAKVFEQTYTRFLDLQKAEAQAREAQIEVALEKVRSRSLAIHKTDELGDVISLVFEKLRELDVTMDSACILTFNQAAKGHTVWAANPDLFSVTTTYVPYHDDPIHKKIYDLREDGQDFIDECWTFEEKNMMYEHFFEHTDWKYFPDDLKQLVLDFEGWGMTGPMLKHTSTLLVSYAQKTYSEHEKEIIKRFGIVFEQAYIRYLDLQKAEAQAREAQIEVALEKVRGRTMAMQRSGELGEVALLLFQQVKSLGINAWGSGFNIWEKEAKVCTSWNAGGAGDIILDPIQIPMTEDPTWIKFYESRLQGEDFWITEVDGEELAEHYRYFLTLPAGEALKKVLTSGFTLPTSQINHIANFAHGNLLFITHEHVPQAHDIFPRFAKVFEQTYIRFLDLQKAEAQSRESQIQLALERVRGRTMAMQRSDELAESSHLLVREVAALGFKTWGCAFHIFRENDSLEWFSNEDGVMPTFIIPREEAWLRYYDACRRGETLYIEEYAGEVCTAHYEYMAALPMVGEALQNLKAAGIPFPTYQIDHVASFRYGYLLFITFEPVPEAHDIFKRFAKVFEQTYTRFLDLKKVEAQARETVKQASLDRVRGEIASMRSTNDLQRITPLVWNELNILGVPFIRCGVFIIHEKQENVEAYLSAPDGHSLGVLNLSFDSSDLTYQSVASWRKGMVYKQHWNRQDFINWSKSLEEQGKITDRLTYQGAGAPPESLDLHFIPFTQGMLYVGNVNPLEEEEINLVKSLAEAFAIAYARYEDFVRIENTLTELRLTQSQLIQSEKMASLGELTAGIAHEIQNPLNFVNNFSEVSRELIEEMREELNKGDIDEAKEIAGDIASNLDKIGHHGNRASGIVKGMLEHSRSGDGVKELTDINTLVDEYLRLSYHGLRAKDKSFNADFKTDFDETLPKLDVVPQDIGRVILNLINNAFYAVSEAAAKQNADLGYKPLVVVSTKKLDNKIEIIVKDNGPGIPAEIKDKVFQPFFTTKPTGSGTGLGLSLSYDIVKAHGGELKVDSADGRGTNFIIILPL